jgi:hypothetical protein
MAGVNVEAIVKQIIDQASKQGGDTWTRVKKSAPLYIRGYAQNLADIAAGVSKGEISTSDAKMYVQNAHLLLAMGIANTSHIMLYEVQLFIDSVLAIVKTAINGALPVAVL